MGTEFFFKYIFISLCLLSKKMEEGQAEPVCFGRIQVEIAFVYPVEYGVVVFGSVRVHIIQS